MENVQNIQIELYQDEPSELVQEWIREFEFVYIEKKDNSEKEYHGCYWWDSNGNEGIIWDTEEPESIDPEAIKSKVKETIIELAKEEGKVDLWMLP